MALMGMTYGLIGTALAAPFPTAVRYTGSSITFNLAGIFGASLAPYIATWLQANYGMTYRRLLSRHRRRDHAGLHPGIRSRRSLRTASAKTKRAATENVAAFLLLSVNALPLFFRHEETEAGMLTRRMLLTRGLGAGFSLTLPSIVRAAGIPAVDVTFLVVNDIHACRVGDGLSPGCQAEGKTDTNLLRHIRALNSIHDQDMAGGGRRQAQRPELGRSVDRKAAGHYRMRRCHRRWRRSDGGIGRGFAIAAVLTPLPAGPRDRIACTFPSMSVSAITISIRTADRRR
jgi:hypothetical protein